ncbi:Phosphorelay intermediate protein YPD1 [Spathaspora sp. JA1]|nr:Phosphorelay intermediate protein YPD1 [Spathaspora sp. JA1]
MAEEKRKTLQATGLVDWPVFSEILAMDEDEEEFSNSLIQTFYTQVEDTFQKFSSLIVERNLEELSKAGHFLKGSASALGLGTIATQCERIQNYGHKINFDNFEYPIKDSISPNNNNLLDENTENNTHNTTKQVAIPDESSDDFWIALIEDALEKAQDGYAKSKRALTEYYS